MPNQISGYQPRVWIDGQLWPAVTGITVEATRPDDAATHQPDFTRSQVKVTLRRLLPVGLSAGNLYPKSGFDMVIVDGWNTFALDDCEWLSVERTLAPDGATEKATVQATVLYLS